MQPTRAGCVLLVMKRRKMQKTVENFPYFVSEREPSTVEHVVLYPCRSRRRKTWAAMKIPNLVIRHIQEQSFTIGHTLLRRLE
jgi:hypothetical protein